MGLSSSPLPGFSGSQNVLSGGVASFSLISGTEVVFAEDPAVLFCSIHQWPLYPGTGAAGYFGRGAGEGMTLNALRFEVADMAQAEASHRQNGVASRRHIGRLVVPPGVAHGATLIFETAK